MIKKFSEFAKTNESAMRDVVYSNKSVLMKLSEATFGGICEILGQKDFNIHYDNSDVLRLCTNDNAFEEVKSMLIDKYGDINISINPDASFWGNKVTIEDDGWKQAYDEEMKKKAAWCSKYGCE